jgi:D-psicose/D-tagatose/L-ribulose 3-epimerase
VAKRINEPATMIHLYNYHTNIEEKGFATALEASASMANYVDLSESDRGVPGSGNIDWKSVMVALKAASFDGDLVVESFVNMPSQLASALSVWRPVARDRDEVLDIGLPFIRSLAQATGLAIGGA